MIMSKVISSAPVKFSANYSDSVVLIVSWGSERVVGKMQFRVFNLFLVSALVSVALACKKLPPKTLNSGRKQIGDNGYRLVIGNNPDDGYEPGKIYNCMC